MPNPRETKVRIRFLETVTTTPWDHLPGDVIETNFKKGRALERCGYAEIVADDTPLTADNPPDDAPPVNDPGSQETQDVSDADVSQDDDSQDSSDADEPGDDGNDADEPDNDVSQDDPDEAPESEKEPETMERKSVVPDNPKPKTQKAVRKGKRKATSR